LRKKANSYSEIESLISAGVSLKGDLSAQGSIRIDGQVEGRLDIKGNLLLGEKGSIKGEVKAGSMVLAGKVEGNVNVVERLDLTRTGVMLGDISAQILTLEEGGILQGNTRMTGQQGEQVPNQKK
jgi:cytoskeletal protein CcmA (bactofilin family)